MKITGLLLAAGSSSRMSPGNKLTLPFRTSTVIEESLKLLLNSSLSPVIVILGNEAETVEPLLHRYKSDRLMIVINEKYKTGRGSSIRKGIMSLDADSDAALFMVADKPALPPDLVDRAVSEFEKHRPPILCIRTPSGRGHPVVFDKKLFDELKGLEGDDIEPALFDKHTNEIHWMDDEPQINVNTVADYEMLLSAEPLPDAR